MALLTILEVPNPLLKKKSEPVAQVDGGIRKLTDDMLETMYEAPGIGLAAPQVGVLKRIVVIDVSRENEPRRPYRMINPVIIDRSEERVMHDEGCLSVPEQYAEVERAKSVTVRYTDKNGEERELHAEGLLAIAVQHELDHLDGKLFIDHLSKVKRDMIVRRVEKERRWKADEAKREDKE